MKLTLMLSLLLLIAPLQAETYRWVDEQGVVTYSQTPPPDQEAQRVKLHGTRSSDDQSSQARLNKLRQQLADSAEDRELEKQEQAEIERAGDVKRKNCEAARANLRKLEGLGNRLYGKEGEYRRLSEEERQDLMQKEREHIQANCGD